MPNTSSFWAWLIDLLAWPFQAAERRHQRRLAALRLERQLLTDLVDQTMTHARGMQQDTAEGVRELAIAQQKLAEALTTWIGMFRQDMGPGSTATVTPSQEEDRETQKYLEELKAKGYPVDADPRIQMQFLMQLGDAQ
jgi:hypothetical protein